MAITSSTYEIPIFLKDHCSTDFNGPADWMNRPCLFTSDGISWAAATDGKSCLAFKLPVDKTKILGEMRHEFLEKIDHKTSVMEVYSDILKPKNDAYKINCNELKTQLSIFTRQCARCNNSRIVNCNLCEATTEVECQECLARGSFPCPTCRKPDQCKICDGLGVVECTRCENGKMPCSCTENETNFFGTIKLGGLARVFNITRLKELLVRFHNQANIVIEEEKITVWDDHKTAVLMILRDNPDNHAMMELDEYARAAQTT